MIHKGIFTLTIAAVVAVLLSVAPAQALAQADGVNLKWKYNAGDKLKLEAVQEVAVSQTSAGRTLEIKTDSITWMEWDVTEIDADGNAIVNTVIKRMTMKQESPGGEMSIDTDNETDEGPGAEQTAAGIRPLIGATIVQKMDNTGKILDVTIPDSVIETLGGTASSQMLEKVSKNATLVFPAEPLKIGDNWESAVETKSPTGMMRVVNTYTYKGLETVEEKELHHFDVDVKMEFVDSEMITINSQETTGNLYFDADAGRIDHSHVKQNVNMTINVQGQTIEQTINQTATLKFVANNE